MYQSPIELLVTDIQHQILQQQDEQIYQAVLSYLPKVDKEELIRALQYDRDQYARGYNDGYAEAKAEVVCCKDCKYWHKELAWCDVHSQFIGSDGMACHPSESSEWKMFGENDFCSSGEKKEE